MKFILRGIVLCFILITLYFASWYIRHNDFYFYTDIARDFLIMQEISDKKIVLIGPRSSASGVFHGPLWNYLNYPGFLIGQGDPLFLGWYWIFLIIVFLIGSFFIAKKLFSETVAWIYLLFLSVDLAFDAHSLFNPHGAYFLMPLFFFLFIRYFQKRKVWYLALLFFVIGCIIQFQLAVGVPLFILSLIPIIAAIYQKKQFTHLFALATILISISPFILFELTHQFIQLKSAYAHVFSNNLDTKTYTNYWGVITDRLHLMVNQGVGLLQYPYSLYHPLIAFLILAFCLWQIKHNQQKIIYLSFLYFYCGFFALSILNKSGGVLPHHYLPLFPLVALVLVSVITVKKASFFKGKYYALLLGGIWVGLAYMYYLNVTNLEGINQRFKSFTGTSQLSWKTILKAAETVYSDKDKELGYFIYMPDSLAYQPKYAMSYASKQHPETKSYYFQKKPVTYLVIAPPPPNNPYMKDDWWRKNQVQITKKPEKVWTFANGYRVEKYLLTEKEQNIPFDPSIDTGLHFR